MCRFIELTVYCFTDLFIRSTKQTDIYIVVVNILADQQDTISFMNENMGNRSKIKIYILHLKTLQYTHKVMSADKQDMSAIAEVPLDTSNPLGMVATLTTIVQDLTRVTIDWTDIGQNGQGILHSLLWNRWRIVEGVGGLWLDHRIPADGN